MCRYDPAIHIGGHPNPGILGAVVQVHKSNAKVAVADLALYAQTHQEWGTVYGI